MDTLLIESYRNKFVMNQKYYKPILILLLAIIAALFVKNCIVLEQLIELYIYAIVFYFLLKYR